MEDRIKNMGGGVHPSGMKKWLQWFLLPALSAFILGRAETVWATLAAEDVKDNLILATEGKIHVEEEFEPPSECRPGTVFVKKPAVCNDSAAACYVRVWILFSDSAAKDQLEPLIMDPAWLPGEDGVWYYTHKLLPGAYTSPVFSCVKFLETTSEEEIEKVLPFDIYVYAESVTAGDRSLQEAWALVKGGEE